MSYADFNPNICRLSDLGFSYKNARDTKSFCVSIDGRFMVTCRSSMKSTGECLLHKLSYCNGEMAPPSAIKIASLSATVKDDNLEDFPPKPKGLSQNFRFHSRQ